MARHVGAAGADHLVGAADRREAPTVGEALVNLQPNDPGTLMNPSAYSERELNQER